MSRIKYGIDLGTTNSAIAELNKGISIIKRILIKMTRHLRVLDLEEEFWLVKKQFLC